MILSPCLHQFQTHTRTLALSSLSLTPHTRYTPQSTRACGCFVSCFRRKQRSRTRRKKQQAIAWKDESAKVGKSPKSNWILYFKQAVTENRPFCRIHGRWLLNAAGEQQRKKALSAFAFLPFLHFLLSLDLSRPLSRPFSTSFDLSFSSHKQDDHLCVSDGLLWRHAVE